MKIISDVEYKLVQLECSCCSSDHTITISMPTKKYLDEDWYSSFEFDIRELSFKERVREASRYWKKRNLFKDQADNMGGLICSKQQLEELYSTLLAEYIQYDLIKESETTQLKQIMLKKIKNEYDDYIAFSCDSGLQIQIDRSEIQGKKLIHNIDICYAPSAETNWWIFNRCLRFVFFPKNYSYPFLKNTVCLSRKELVEILGVLNWLSNNLKPLGEDGPYEVENEDSIKFE